MKRIERLRDLMPDDVIMLVSTMASQRYLLGVDVGAAVVTMDDVALFTPVVDFPGVKSSFEGVVYPYASEEEFLHELQDYVEQQDPRSVAIEMRGLDAITFHLLDHHVFPGIMIQDASRILARLRQEKDDGEVARVKRAAEIADAGMQAAFDALEPGITEAELAGEAEYAMRMEGAEGWSQPATVSTRSTAAHGGTTSREIRWGDVIVIRLAPVVEDYTAIIARSTVLGEPTDEQRDAYRALLRAQQSTAGVLYAGTPLVQVEETMNRWLEQAGYAESYPLPLFHGVGLDPVEAPIVAGHGLSPASEPTDNIVRGMTLAVGVSPLVLPDYSPEDTIWVSNDGPVPLTRFDHDVL